MATYRNDEFDSFDVVVAVVLILCLLGVLFYA